MASLFKIGTDSAHLVTLDSLGLPDPAVQFAPYAQTSIMADGTAVGRGFPVTTWQFGYLTLAQRDNLRDYCPGASAVVAIDTMSGENSDAHDIYNCVMRWPFPENREPGDVHKRLNFSVEFHRLVAV